MTVHGEHDLRRRFAILIEILLDDRDHEFHRRVVIVQQRHLVEWRRFYGLPLQQLFGLMLRCHGVILMLSGLVPSVNISSFSCASILRVFPSLRRWRSVWG